MQPIFNQDSTRNTVNKGLPGLGWFLLSLRISQSQSIAICKPQINPGVDNTLCFGGRVLGREENLNLHVFTASLKKKLFFGGSLDLPYGPLAYDQQHLKFSF